MVRRGGDFFGLPETSSTDLVRMPLGGRVRRPPPLSDLSERGGGGRVFFFMAVLDDREDDEMGDEEETRPSWTRPSDDIMSMGGQTSRFGFTMKSKDLFPLIRRFIG